MRRVVMGTVVAWLLVAAAAVAQAQTYALTQTPPVTGPGPASSASSTTGSDGRGLKWTGVGLLSAGGALVLGAFTFNDAKGCGFFNELACDDVGRVYGGVGAGLIISGLTLMVIDDLRHQGSAKDLTRQRRATIEVGPRTVRLRVRF